MSLRKAKRLKSAYGYVGGEHHHKPIYILIFSQAKPPIWSLSSFRKPVQESLLSNDEKIMLFIQKTSDIE